MREHQSPTIINRWSAGYLGAWASLAVAISTLAALVTALAWAPARSGPNCRGNDCIGYPFTDAAEFVPSDYVWMYPAMLLALSLVFWVNCMLARTGAAASVLGIFSIAATAMGALTLLLAYSVQVMVVQPSLQRNEVRGLELWSEYNPHGIFIALENLGYWLVALALLVVSMTLSDSMRIERWLKRLLLAGGAIVVLALPIMGVLYRGDLEYRYEVFAILILWPLLIITGLLTSRWFKL